MTISDDKISKSKSHWLQAYMLDKVVAKKF